MRVRVRTVVVLVSVLVSLLAASRAGADDPAWPGGASVSVADDANVFGANLSGLAYQPSGSSAPGVLWAVRNAQSTLFRLIWDGSKWTPDTANGWTAGKQLFYPNGTGVPDAEGVTLAAGDPNTVYVSTERNADGIGADNTTSRTSVLRYDVTGAGATLTADQEFDLTPDLPGLGANLGLEAITWVPDDFLVARGLIDESTASAYNPASYPNHGTGLFFVGVEQDGRIIAYALNQASGTFARVATISGVLPAVMDLEYEPDSGHLWAVCDDTCDGRVAALDIAQSGPNDGKFGVTSSYARPSGMPNLNNEGFAITPQAECVNGLKPVFWSDDSNTGQHALRAGTLNCTVPTPPAAIDSDGDGVPDASDACPTVAPPPGTDLDGDGCQDPSALPDSTPPKLAIDIATKQKVAKAAALTATCDEPCQVSAEGTLRTKYKQGHHTKHAEFDLKPADGSVATAGGSVDLQLKLAHKAKRAASKALAHDGKAKVSGVATASDPAGNKATAQFKTALR